MTDYRIGYCTNVHAGADWNQTLANLKKHAVAVRERFRPRGTMGIGLWLSANSVQALTQQPQGVEAFRDWLGENGLVPFTLNGFPYGDFHQPVVKHRVYEPTWWDQSRLDYTLHLADVLDQLLPAGEIGSISTLPIAWGRPMPAREKLAESGTLLKRAAEHLERLEQGHGRLITICLEPEPGCVFDTSRGLIDYFHQSLLDGPDHERVRRYIRVCHDVCHAAVMFEDQAAMIKNLADAGIGIGKVQISSAVCVDFAPLSPNERAAAFRELSGFNEPRYLHQTVVKEPTGKQTFHEDLSLALKTVTDPAALATQWHIHFHVPVYLERFGHLNTSQADILATLHATGRFSDVRHYEVETYAWGVLPAELQQPSLAAGIADEMAWFDRVWGAK
jgi:hypothetical protein